MAAPTDIHRALRDALAAAVATALADADVTVAVIAQDTPNPALVDLPAVIVSYGGSESYRGGTNARDDVAYPMVVGLYTVQGDADTTEAGNEPPGLRPTLFREILRARFGNRRVVTAPTGISLFPSEYDPAPPINDDGGPAMIQQLRTAVGVTVPARVPRGNYNG